MNVHIFSKISFVYNDRFSSHLDTSENGNCKVNRINDIPYPMAHDIQADLLLDSGAKNRSHMLHAPCHISATSVPTTVIENTASITWSGEARICNRKQEDYDGRQLSYIKSCNYLIDKLSPINIAGRLEADV